jgi:aspartyl-tRNA(Asn)/glutamyl-tRNA(Gln) amidotransferase subunit A
LLDGVPVTIKDNLHVCGLPTTWGSRGLAGLVADQDELAVARLRAAGTIIIGKTNVPEFTLEGYTSNPVFGTTRNPWNLALTPGGSSGGAVASVAAGIAPLALGTDGGGSTRRPAAHCGLVGFKPSIGAIARTATLPSLLLDFEVVGTMARTMADTQLLFDAVRGPDPADRASLAAAQGALACAAPGRALRILYVERFGNAPLDPQIAASVRASVQQLAALGHQVDEGALPLDLEFFNDAWPQVGQIGLAAMFRAQPAWREGASPKYREMAAQGEKLSATRLWLILAQVQSLRCAAAALFERIDVVITPATAALPWSADEAYPPQIEGRLVGPRGHAIYTGWVNAAGLPGLALPCAPSRKGLPIGLQLVGAYGADQQLLTLGTSFEAAAPWSGRWPVSESF